MIKIRGLTKAYAKSGVNAVENLNLDIEGGQIFGFLGPNGAGKTTLIKLVTGILPFEYGTIEICGANLLREPEEAKRNIGYVPDNHSVYERLTGREYVNLLADIYGVDAQTRERRAEDLLDKFSLRDDYNNQIRKYSHGMRQKISIIGALIHEPKVWILDEPLTGLDPQSSFILKKHMREHCEKGNCVFFSTHVLEVAEKVCDRVGIISKGRLIMQGSMDEIKSRQNDKSLEDIFLSVTENSKEQLL